MKERSFIVMGVTVAAAAIGIISLARHETVVIRFVLPGLALVIVSAVLSYVMRHGASNSWYGISKRDYYKKSGKQKCGDLPSSSNPLDILLQLPKEYIVIHHYERNGLDLEYVVIGPTGIFILDSNGIRGSIDVAGDHLILDGKHAVDKAVEKVKRSARRMGNDFKTFNARKNLLKAVLCFPHAAVKGASGKIFSDVLVASGDDLIETIQGHPQLLDAADIVGICSYLKKNANYASCRELRSKGEIA